MKCILDRCKVVDCFVLSGESIEAELGSVFRDLSSETEYLVVKEGSFLRSEPSRSKTMYSKRMGRSVVCRRQSGGSGRTVIVCCDEKTRGSRRGGRRGFL